MSDALCVLIVGSGGREHAMADSALRSAHCGRLLVTPGNAGTPGERFNVAADDVVGIVALCQTEKVDLVLVGPEAPLAAGVVDQLISVGIAAFGPSQYLAQLESSKSFAREVTQQIGIDGPRFASFSQGNVDAALAWWKELAAPVVVKQSGLAGGKGVVVPETDAATVIAIQEACALGEVVLEEKIYGYECSLIAVCDGTTAVPLPIAQDHKRISEGDRGLNTGGMGAYAPVNVGISPHELCAQFIQPTLDYFAALGHPYVGVLYAGIMMTASGPKLLEYNCRFGDPEAQVLLTLLETSIVDVALACLAGQLKQFKMVVSQQSAMAVVLASAGYPESSSTGDVIQGLEARVDGASVFHGATSTSNSNIVTDGGRVLTVVGRGKDLAQARAHAYERVEKISFTGAQYRRDIGWRSLALSVKSYSSTGVNIDEGNRAVSLLKSSVASTANSNVLAGVGSFGGALDVSHLKKYDHPVLVGSTDGVGTKVELAARSGRFRGVGMDIVNHCVNDVLVQGARPLFFLDYLASSEIQAEMVAAVVDGMSQACRDNECVLLGGETAEMPGVYSPGAFDIAGTLVGVVEKEQLLPRSNVAVGDVLIGLASNGPHTNGYSLLRKIFGWLPDDAMPEPLQVPILDALLVPHRSYLHEISPLLHDPRLKGLIHITGGGLPENVPRVLPEGVGADIQLDSWTMPPLFQLVREISQLDTHELYRTLNMGIGMIVIVGPEDVALIQGMFDEETWVIGELVPRAVDEPRVRLLP
jgi:phosphoribosylamine--glycine ligase/phosphoribosylaminoimidazole synthetase